jgi:hypothetical protein
MATVRLQTQSSADDNLDIPEYLRRTPNSAGSQPVSAPALDPFDLNNLRLDQSFVETAGVKKLLTTVPVRRSATPARLYTRACRSRVSSGAGTDRASR